MSEVHVKVGGTQLAQLSICDLSIGLEMEDKVQPSIGTYTNHLSGANV